MYIKKGVSNSPAVQYLSSVSRHWVSHCNACIKFEFNDHFKISTIENFFVILTNSVKIWVDCYFFFYCLCRYKLLTY